MQKFYFTFGSSEQYPYQDTYMVVEAKDLREALATFREKYPDRSEGIVNCSFYYTEEQWNASVKTYYEGQKPAEVLKSETAQKERLKVLLENAIKVAIEESRRGYSMRIKTWILPEIGTTEEELAELGIDFMEVFK